MRSFIAVAACCLLFACHPQHVDDAMELRLYEVPQGTARSLVRTMSDVMWLGENKNAGRAAATADGRIAVLATPSVQSGVQSLIDEVTKHPPKTDQTIELHYFLVLAKPGAAAPFPPGAAEIKDGLDEIVRLQGPQAFTLASRASMTSLHDEEGRLDNHEEKLELHQHAIRSGEGVYARLSIRSQEDRLDTNVHLAGDRIVVLGTAGRSSGTPDAGTLYYLVRLAPQDGKAP
jgi:hypothetical protein